MKSNGYSQKYIVYVIIGTVAVLTYQMLVSPLLGLTPLGSALLTLLVLIAATITGQAHLWAKKHITPEEKKPFAKIGVYVVLSVLNGLLPIFISAVRTYAPEKLLVYLIHGFLLVITWAITFQVIGESD